MVRLRCLVLLGRAAHISWPQLRIKRKKALETEFAPELVEASRGKRALTQRCSNLIVPTTPAKQTGLFAPLCGSGHEEQGRPGEQSAHGRPHLTLRSG
jgi:hypothetical protein